MSKFQVGDRVMRVNAMNASHWVRTRMDQRPIHEVVEVQTDKIRLAGCPVWWWVDNFQLRGHPPERSCSDCTHSKSADPKCGLCTGPGDPAGRFDPYPAEWQGKPLTPLPQPATAKEETVNTEAIKAAQKAAAKADAKLAAARAELDAATAAAAAARQAAREELDGDIALAEATLAVLLVVKDSPTAQLTPKVAHHATQLEPLANKHGYTITLVAGRAFLEEV